ncbi:MAG: ATPase [Alphaproteobacteria bacterium]|nr:ATPase [Alphaproteobacteria bacterium]
MWQLRAASLLCLLLLAAVEPTGAQTAPREVLLLHSFGQRFGPWSTISAQLRGELIRRSPDPVDLHDVSLESMHPIDDPEPFLRYLRSLFANRPPDLSIAMGGPAVRFVLQHRTALFPAVPLLITGTDARTFEDIAGAENSVAVVLALDQTRQIENIRQLLPDVRHVAVIIGDSELERFYVDELKRVFRPFEPGLSFEWLNKLSLDAMVERVARLPPNSAIYYGRVLVDTRGISYEGDHALERLRAATNAPIFNPVDSNFGTGIVGGPMIETRLLAQESATAALRLLRGEPPAGIAPVIVGPGPPRYDARELDRWNISESRLPPGSQILFREPSVWDQYQTHIMAIVAALLLQTGLISWLLYEHRRRHTAEVRSRGMMSELTQMNRLATAGELSASIAHEISQPLTRVMANSGVAMRVLSEEQPDLEKARELLRQLQSACDRAVAVVTSTRAMFAKDDQTREPIDLPELVRSVLVLVRHDLRRHQVHVEQHFGDPPLRVLGDKIQLQQVILNLVMNAVEAMQARKIRVLRLSCIHGEDKRITVAVADTGSGIEPDHLARIFDPLFSTKQRGMGMGLAICRSIVEGHEGRIWASPAPEGGSIFRFALPAYDETGQRSAEASPPPRTEATSAADAVTLEAADPGDGTNKPAAA